MIKLEHKLIIMGLISIALIGCKISMELEADKNKKPNILFIMSDGWYRWNISGANGSKGKILVLII